MHCFSQRFYNMFVKLGVCSCFPGWKWWRDWYKWCWRTMKKLYSYKQMILHIPVWNFKWCYIHVFIDILLNILWCTEVVVVMIVLVISIKCTRYWDFLPFSFQIPWCTFFGFDWHKKSIKLQQTKLKSRMNS